MFNYAKSAAAIVSLLLVCVTSFAQTRERQEESAASVATTEAVAKEIAMLRQSVQSLDATIGDIAAKLLPVFTKGKDGANESQNRISSSFTLLTQAEQRAEMLRKQLFELIEKETLYRTRITQLEEDMRPENVERAMNPYGTTRTAELRDNRRRVLDTERKGFESLLSLVSQSRLRLDEELKQADLLVTKIRLRLNPLIEKEIEKINPNQP